MDLEILHIIQELDFMHLLLVVLIGLHIVELAVIGFVAAWSVQIVRNDQQRLEKEWLQVLQILAHRGAHGEPAG